MKSPEMDQKELKIEKYHNWLKENWFPGREDQNLRIMTVDGKSILNINSLERVIGYEIDGFTYVGYSAIKCDVVIEITSFKGHKPNVFSGAYVFQFAYRDNFNDIHYIDIPLLSGTFQEADINQWVMWITSVAAIPEAFMSIWGEFEKHLVNTSNSLDKKSEVIVIGGKIEKFEPTTDWADVILSPELSTSIRSDINNFFNKGVGIYQKLKLKPFRKIMLAGPPGTGKTMISTAIAKEAISNSILVIYVSSVVKDGDRDSSFSRIERSISMAASSNRPCIIIVEEFDTYLHSEQKSMILNILDGNEVPSNPKGILMITTTNYPEIIDDRILKRPGRLDRIFIIPEVKFLNDAKVLLRKYLGDMWKEEHNTLAKQLVGYSPAFVREVAILALTQCACADLDELPADILNDSFFSLKDQIDARDEYLGGRPEFTGLNANKTAVINQSKGGSSLPGISNNNR